MDRYRPDIVTLDQFEEQALQGGPLVGLQHSEKRLIVAVGDLCQLGKDVATPPRQGKQPNAVVLRLGRTCDPVLRFEFVDHLGNGSARQCQSFGEFPGRDPRPFPHVA
jgi:hypothetical protein